MFYKCHCGPRVKHIPNCAPAVLVVRSLSAQQHLRASCHFATIVGALGAMFMYFLIDYQPFVETVGFLAVFTEATLGNYSLSFIIKKGLQPCQLNQNTNLSLKITFYFNLQMLL